MKIYQQTSLLGVHNGEWRKSPRGTHVALPLDVSQVSEAVVEKVANEISGVAYESPQAVVRAAIAALAKSLAEES